jgi:uncharacterized protein (TIGR04255 family)
MTVASPPLRHPPIVEAVVDLDCDVPAGFDLVAVEGPAMEAFADRYPTSRRRVLHQHRLAAAPDVPPEYSNTIAVDALQFTDVDQRQVVQIRKGGFSFNRLAPYSSFDEYLPEIERRWKQYVALVSPVQVRRVALRFINRIPLPAAHGLIGLSDFIRLGPRLVDEQSMELTGFLHQQSMRELETGHAANTTMVMQPMEDGKIPIIFDIEVMHVLAVDPGSWNTLAPVLESLRRLKNSIFWRTLEDRCLNLFR